MSCRLKSSRGYFSSYINTGWTLWWTTAGPLRLTVLTVSASKLSSLSICSGFKSKSQSSQTHHTGIRYMGLYPAFVLHNQSPFYISVKGPKMSFFPPLFSVRFVWRCCSWKVWRTATMNSCHFLLDHSPSIHLASCNLLGRFLYLLILVTQIIHFVLLLLLCLYI